VECYLLSQGKETERASDLNDPNHQNKIFQIAKLMVKERQDITGSICLKEVSGKVTEDEKGIEDSWKEYMEKLMNEENEWDHRMSDQQTASRSMKLQQH